MADDANLGPDPELLARGLLVAEAGVTTSAEALAAAGEQAYLRLRTRLAALLGARGFDALWFRAISRIQPTLHSEDDPVAADSVPTDAYGLHTAVRGHALAVVEQTLVSAFASFITLLFTFIGAELGCHFLRQIWPDLPHDAVEPGAEETTP